MELKELLLEHCYVFIKHRLNSIHQRISEIETALLQETKSSAGDKHETGRAMLHLEREKLGRQLFEVQRINQELSNIDPKSTSERVILGSIIYSSEGNYFIAISAGQQEAEGEIFYAISKETPIGRLLLNKKVGDSVTFRGQKITLSKIL